MLLYNPLNFSFPNNLLIHLTSVYSGQFFSSSWELENKNDKTLNTQSIKNIISEAPLLLVFLASLLADSKSDDQLYNWNSNTSYLKNKPLKSKTEINFKGQIETTASSQTTWKGKQVKEDRKISEIHGINSRLATCAGYLVLKGRTSSWTSPI